MNKVIGLMLLRLPGCFTFVYIILDNYNTCYQSRQLYVESVSKSCAQTLLPEQRLGE